MIGRNTGRLRSLVEDLLTLWAYDTSEVRLDRTNLDLAALLSECHGGRVLVRAENSGEDVVVTVEDSGIGIPADEQERLFSRFFRSSLSMSAEIQDTGLGLALTKTLVERHGGSVALTSAEGVGNTVTVRLPVTADA